MYVIKLVFSCISLVKRVNIDVKRKSDIYLMLGNSNASGAIKSKLISAMSRFRVVPEDRRLRIASVHSNLHVYNIRANVEQIPDAVRPFERTSLEILIHFRKSSVTYPWIVTRDERSRSTRI